MRLSWTGLVLGLMGLRLLVALFIAWQTPLWERFDEVHHYQYIHFVAHEGHLPTMDDYPPVRKELYAYIQYSQPPLYYITMAPLVAWLNPYQNSHAYANPPPICRHNINYYFLEVHHMNPLMHHMALSAWAVRLATIVIGVASVGVLMVALAIWGWRSVAITAGLLYALHPAFVMPTTYINNDAPIYLLGAVLLYGMARWHRHNQLAPRQTGSMARQQDASRQQTGSRPIRSPLLTGVGWKWLLTLWVVMLMGMFIKLSALAALPVLALWSLRYASRRWLLRLVGVVLLIGAGFVMVNQMQCGRWICRTYTSVNDLTLDMLQQLPLTGDHYGEAYWHLLETAAVSHVNYGYWPPAPAWLWLNLMLMAVGVMGGVLVARLNKDKRALILWLLWLVLAAWAVAHWRVWWTVSGYMAFRYWAIASPALAALLAYGLTHLFGLQWARRLVLVWTLVLLVVSWAGGHAPLFDAPQRLTHLPDTARAIPSSQADSNGAVRYANGVLLGGYEYRHDGIRLYWGLDGPLQTTDNAWDAIYFAHVRLMTADGTLRDQCGYTLGHPRWTPLDWRVGEWVVQDFKLLPSRNPWDRLQVMVYPLQPPVGNTVSLDFRHPVAPSPVHWAVAPGW